MNKRLKPYLLFPENSSSQGEKNNTFVRRVWSIVVANYSDCCDWQSSAIWKSFVVAQAVFVSFYCPIREQDTGDDDRTASVWMLMGDG